MVVFTCNHCGETLQKPKVAKHYEFQCRTAPFLTCIDCLKDFRGEEYVAHTKCITEAERYGGKDYVPKAGANKGERKQQEWLNIVNGILNNSKNLSNTERNFLNTLSKYDNIPRKKAKFLNFVKNAVGNKVNLAVIDSVWDKLETAHKNNVQTITQIMQKQKQQNDKGDHKANDKSNVSEHQESNIIENQNNENIHKENQNEEEHEKSNNNDNNVSKKKKSKKRKADEAVEENTVEPVSKKKGKIIHTEDQVEDSVSKKRDRSIVLSESSVNQNGAGQTNEKSTFDWKGTILDIVRNKGEISLKKLQKKVISQYMKFCSNDVSNEKAKIRFNKKFKKVSGVLVSDEKVTLA
ncbi:uncharacterized protein LOC143212433 [Lasioglossum baleicum]|uniref:uncharacterized protein LOC143212433 n=1 Tax=Lasioglossum baleicum TaxID=434251 RepID=UPI003FCD45E5